MHFFCNILKEYPLFKSLLPLEYLTPCPGLSQSLLVSSFPWLWPLASTAPLPPLAFFVITLGLTTNRDLPSPSIQMLPPLNFKIQLRHLLLQEASGLLQAGWGPLLCITMATICPELLAYSLMCLLSALDGTP